MLYPRENRARAVMNLDGEWSFCLDDGTGLTRHWEREPLKNAEHIAVPTMIRKISGSTATIADGYFTSARSLCRPFTGASACFCAWTL